MTPEQLYSKQCAKRSDINEHLPELRVLATQCRHVTEFGFRGGVSTIALLCAEPEIVTTYDIDEGCQKTYEFLKPYADTLGVKFVFHVDDTGTFVAPPTDFLFIDTWHNAVQITKELALSGNSARKFMAFHDTVTFAKHGEKGGEGIKRPILEFLTANPHWQIRQEFTNNNGLLVLERK